MQVKHSLEVYRRERTGTRYAKRERELGRLPVVLYGHGRDPVSLALDAKAAITFIESGERVFDIELKDEGVRQTVLLKDIQFDYLGTNIIHLDLTRVDLDEVIESAVRLRLVGEAKGLKAAGAVLSSQNDTVTVRCTVAALPEEIDVRISDLDVNETIHAGSIELPEGVELASDPEDLIAAITVMAEIDTSAEAEEVGAEAAEPEVISEKRDDAGAGGEGTE
jgi:large subunit ribosomal protein L25